MSETLTQIITILLLSAGLVVTMAAVAAVVAAIAPAATGRIRDRFASRPWLPLVLGVLISTPWLLASLVIMQMSGGLVWVGLMLMLIWTTMALVGLSGVAVRVGFQWGGGGGGDAQEEHQSIAQCAWIGGLLLGTAAALPIIGWFLIGPAALMAGVGSLVLALIPAKERVPASHRESESQTSDALQLQTCDA